MAARRTLWLPLPMTVWQRWVLRWPQGNRDALNRQGLTLTSGFQGAAGIFRLREDGTVERGLAVATIEGNQVVVLSPAPRSFSSIGF
jgi:hypothetical protein